MIRKGLFAIGLLAAWSSVQAQDVTTYTPGAQEEGVVYYLPKTKLEIKVKTVKVTYTPGELCQYANRYLRLQEIAAQPSEHWELESVEVTPVGVPDMEKAYSIKLKDKMATSQVELTNDGIIKAINSKSPKEDNIRKEATPEKPKRVDPRSFMTEEILMAGSTNKMAELIAKEIYSIRESKNSLTRGQADYMPQDGAALQIMLNNLETQERALTEMFAGFTDRTEKITTFYVDPSKEMTNVVIFRFSKKLGIVKEKDLAGEPIYLTISDMSSLPPADEEAKAKKKLDGVIYNIPGKGRVSIDSFDKNYYEDELPITQFGETEVLINGLFNKKINTRVIFNPTTGGISKIDKD